MISHAITTTRESVPEVDASPLMITVVEEALDICNKDPQPARTFQKRLDALSMEELRLLPSYIIHVRHDSIANECVRELEKANVNNDFKPEELGAIIEQRDSKLQIAKFLCEIARESFEKRNEDVRYRTIEFITFGHMTLRNIVSLTEDEVRNIMRQPRRAEDSLH